MPSFSDDAPLGIRAVEVEVEACEAHLEATGAVNEPVGVFLARYLLIKAYAEFELAILSIVRARGELIADPELRSFYRGAGRPRDWTIKELGNFLGRFDEDKRTRFIATTQLNGLHVRYNNMMTNRHVTAHDHGASVTFPEVVLWLRDASQVIDAFAEALDVPKPT